MKLYFLRHATAEDFASSDAERALTRDGEKEAAIAGGALRELGVKPAHIFTSPLLRAQQTARIAAQALGHTGKVEVLDELLNEADTKTLVRALKSHADTGDILLVGHMPSLAEHVAVLIGVDNANGIPLSKGAIACVKLTELRIATGVLRWLMCQKQLRAVAK